MRLCVIFNPTARGEKAARFRRWLNKVGQDCVLKPTPKPGAASELATAAVNDGFDTIVAAGGDGTVNEVLNGIVGAKDGLKRARLAVLPLGTVNVFARELKIPARLNAAWGIIRGGRERLIDLPRADFQANGTAQHRYFAQLAGAGLDTRAIELVSWDLKKKVGPLAYVAAGLKAMNTPHPTIQVKNGTEIDSGELVLLGNGRLYGGSFKVFPKAELSDGLLDAAVFPKVNWPILIHTGISLLTTKLIPRRYARHVRATSIEVTGPPGTGFEVDGEWCGHLPATFSVQKQVLRVVVP